MTECIKCDDEAIVKRDGDPMCPKHASVYDARQGFKDMDL